MSEKKTVLVTGASGFLGKAVIRQLAGKDLYDVVAVVSGRREVSFPEGVRVEAANLLQESDREKLIENVRPHILVHLAWDQADSDFRGAASNMQWLEVSTSLLRAFTAQKGQLFFFAGTSSEYDEDSGKAQEIFHPQRMSMYGECKKAFAAIMKNYCSRNGVRYIDARYFTIYGENDPHRFGAIPQAISDLLHDKPVVCRAPNTIRDYIYVEDAARATAMLLESGLCGSVNVGSGRPRLMREVFTLIAKTLHKESLLSFENEDKCDLILVADTGVLRNELGFVPAFPFEETMERTIEWWKWQKFPRGGVTLPHEDRQTRTCGCWPRKRVLITGGSGLIGRAVVEAVYRRQKYEIVVVTSGKRQTQFPQGITIEKADLLDPGSLAALMERVSPDVLIHLAWGLENGSFLASDGNIRWLEASMRLLELFWRYGGERCVFAGSSSEYGSGSGGNSESAGEVTYTLYGICKLAFDNIASCYCRSVGMQFATARYFSVYGPGDVRPGRALPMAIRTLMAGEPFLCKSPWNVWDYIYVEDAAEATARLVESGYCGAVNVASGQPMTMRDAFSVVADVLGRPDLMRYDTQCRVSSSLTADCARAGSVLGDYQKVPFRDGIEKTVQWWRDRESG